jgi:DNA-binding response OmpR family regulator
LISGRSGFERAVTAGGQRMLKVLIVEDDLMLADFAEEILVEHEYEVCGIARIVAEALALARRSRPDLVILDLRLADGGLGTEFASQLPAVGRPGILYVTGNMSQLALTSADGDACLSKPYRSADLIRGLEIVAGIVATGEAQPPFPAGFQPLRPAPTESRAVLT